MNPQGIAVWKPQPLTRVPSDLLYVEDVVRVNFPVESARTYLRRHMGNPVRVQLVEALRGEKLGHVRSVEILPFAGGNSYLVRAVRTLPDGSPASLFVPDDMIVMDVEVLTPDGRPPDPLSPKDAIVLHVPVRSYLRYLPGLYQGAVPASRRDVVRADPVSTKRWGLKDEITTQEVTSDATDALRRLLLIFQHEMTTIVDKVDGIPSLTDPAAADARFLPWIASWVNFELDASLPVHQQRELVRRAIRLYRTRGTKEGVEEMVRVLTSVPVRVLERTPPPSMTLGKATLSGGSTIMDRFRKKEPASCFIVEPKRPATRYFVLLLESRVLFERRFGERAAGVLERIARVVSTEKPAHITFTIQFETSEP